MEVMKVFGAMLQGNMSMTNLGASLGTLLQSPAGKSKDIFHYYIANLPSDTRNLSPF